MCRIKQYNVINLGSSTLYGILEISLCCFIVMDVVESVIFSYILLRAHLFGPC